jgi:hypothetical protein
MVPFFAGLILLFSVNSYATCMAECVQNEKDVTVVTSCAAPGGPVRTTTEVYQDHCEDHSLIKYTCGGMAGMRYPLTELYACKKCSDVNTCEEVLFIIQ